jgi:hypothetical protein
MLTYYSTVSKISKDLQEGTTYPMHIVCHVNNVVDNFRNLLDRKTLEVPERGWGSNTERLFPRQPSANSLQEFEIVRSVVFAPWRNAGNVRSTYDL